MLALPALEVRAQTTLVPPLDGLGIPSSPAMASPKFPLSLGQLPLERGMFPELPGESGSPRGDHTPDSSDPSPASSAGRWPLREQGTSPIPASSPLNVDEEAQGVMALAAGRYRPKDWKPDPLPSTPPKDTISGYVPGIGFHSALPSGPNAGRRLLAACPWLRKALPPPGKVAHR